MTRFAAMALVVAAIGCSGERARLEDLAHPDPQDAAANYHRSCAPCHGADGRGGGPVATAMATPPPDLTVLRARAGGRYPRDLVVATILGDHEIAAHGTREMPVWATRYAPESGAEAAAALWARRRVELLADYVGTLQRAE